MNKHQRLEIISSTTLFITFCFYLISCPLSQTEPILKADVAKFDYFRSKKPLKGKAAAYKPLQGGVSLSHSLPPTPPSLHKGAIFEKANIPKTPKITDWYLIPSWLAGEWHRETVAKVFPIDPFGIFTFSAPPYIERADHLWGHQIDSLGGIWHHRNEPYIQMVENSQYVFSKTITLQEPLLVSDSKVIMHYKDLTVTYRKTDHTIFNTHQHEQISEITKQGDLLYEDIKSKNFNENGVCTDEDHGKTTYTMIKPFHPTNIDKNSKLNLQEDFKLYLKAHGYVDRLPHDLPQQKKE